MQPIIWGHFRRLRPFEIRRRGGIPHRTRRLPSVERYASNIIQGRQKARLPRAGAQFLKSEQLSSRGEQPSVGSFARPCKEIDIPLRCARTVHICCQPVRPTVRPRPSSVRPSCRAAVSQSSFMPDGRTRTHHTKPNGALNAPHDARTRPCDRAQTDSRCSPSLVDERQPDWVVQHRLIQADSRGGRILIKLTSFSIFALVPMHTIEQGLLHKRLVFPEYYFVTVQLKISPIFGFRNGDAQGYCRQNKGERMNHCGLKVVLLQSEPLNTSDADEIFRGAQGVPHSMW